jgi:S1-C subfamily serine protease
LPVTGPANLAWLGLKVVQGGGAYIMDTLLDGPAKAAGRQAGDLIVTFNGQDVTSGKALIDMMRQMKPGQPVTLEFFRACALQP